MARWNLRENVDIIVKYISSKQGESHYKTRSLNTINRQNHP